MNRCAQLESSINQDSINQDTPAHKALRALLVADPQPRFIEAWKSAIKDHLRQRAAAANVPPHTEFTAEIAASTMVTAYTYLIKNPYAASDAAARSVLAKALSILDGQECRLCNLCTDCPNVPYSSSRLCVSMVI